VSVSTLGRELFLVVSSTGSGQKRRNSSVRISSFGNGERLGRHAEHMLLKVVLDY